MQFCYLAVYSTKAAEEFLRHKELGSKLYQNFVTDRVQGDQSIWEPMKKSNLKTFKSLNKKVKIEVGEKIYEMKEERNTMSRSLIAARKRPEMEIEQCIGEYKFSVVPRSLFSYDGQPH